VTAIGAEETYTIEACMQNGWALQCGTSHFLGQNFAKAFNVRFSTIDGNGALDHVWGTSWGVSTRLLGAVVMSHSDDVGLVLPPSIAPAQVVLIPVIKGNKSLNASVNEEEKKVLETILSIEKALIRADVRCEVDVRDGVSLGTARYEWERKGVPIRIEVGSRDLKKGVALVSIRHNLSKSEIPLSSDRGVEYEEFARNIQHQLGQIQQDMYEAAKQRLVQRTYHVDNYLQMKSILESSENISRNKESIESGGELGNADNRLGFFIVPWKENAANEQFIKTDCKATIRCYPDHLNQVLPEGKKCFYSGEPATHIAIFARAF
jgi:prolyl-tRNA synthetase